MTSGIGFLNLAMEGFDYSTFSHVSRPADPALRPIFHAKLYPLFDLD